MRFFDIRNIRLIDLGALSRMLPGRPGWNPFSTQAGYISAILRSQKTFDKYDINTALRLAHFIGQGLIETGFLRYRSENLNYSTDALMRVFPRHFKDRNEAKQYARKPEKIANRVYSNRLGNGDEASGDGWRYRGRGFFQLTGKDNYRYYGELSGIDLVGKPDLIEKNLRKSVEVAAAYFGKTGLGEHADRNDAKAVSRGVNRGNPTSSFPAHGEAERIVWTNRAIALVRNPDKILKGNEDTSAPEGTLAVGDTGPSVEILQEKLDQLGYAVGFPDGVYGQQTRRAVLAFQDEYGLPANGVADNTTLMRIDEALQDPRSARSVGQEMVTANDMRKHGARDVHRTGQAGNAGAAGGVVAGGVAANEAGLVEQGTKIVRDVLAAEEGEDLIDGEEDAPAPEEEPAEIPTDVTAEDDAPTEDAPEGSPPTETEETAPEADLDLTPPAETSDTEEPAEDTPDEGAEDAAMAAAEEEPTTTTVDTEIIDDETEDLATDEPTADDGVVTDLPEEDPVVATDTAPEEEITPAPPTDEDGVIDPAAEAADVETIDTPVEAEGVDDTAPAAGEIADEAVDDIPTPEAAPTVPLEPAEPLPPIVEPENRETAPTGEETIATVEQPSAPPPSETGSPTDKGDPVTMALLLAIVVIGFFSFFRSRQAIDDRVDEARYGR